MFEIAKLRLLEAKTVAEQNLNANQEPGPDYWRVLIEEYGQAIDVLSGTSHLINIKVRKAGIETGKVKTIVTEKKVSTDPQDVPTLFDPGKGNLVSSDH